MHDPRDEVHRHEPERQRHHGHDEREWVEPQRHEARQDRDDLHRQPAALHPHVKSLIMSGTSGIAPPSERILDAEHREREHPDRHGDHETARRRQRPPVPQIMAAGGKQRRVDQSGDRQRSAAHLLERQRREQAHGAHDDERARVPEKMHEIEANALIGTRRRRCRADRGRARPQHREKPFDLFVAKRNRSSG